MKADISGLVCGEINQLGVVKSILILTSDQEKLRVSKNQNWEGLLSLIGSEIEASGSVYFSENKQRVLNIKKFRKIESG